MVVRDKMTEQYLLDELSPEARSEFEEHFFECRDCAQDVRAAVLFLEQSRQVLGEAAEAAAPARQRVPEKQTAGWLAWLRPAFAAPALAALLLVVGYQNLVTLPRLSKANSAQVLPWASVNVGTFAGDGTTITVPRDSGFVLFLRIPPDRAYSRYTADLYNPSGKVEWSLAIPAAEGQDQWPVQVPAARREAGTYTLKLAGVSSAGESKQVGQASFELQFQK